MATATKDGTSRRGRGNAWTAEEVEGLKKAVAAAKRAGKPVGTAFEKVAKERGTSPSAVQAKYYAVGGGKRRRKSSARKAAASTRPATASTTSTDGRARSGGPTDFKSLSNVELAKLVRGATAELEGRMTALEANVRKLLG